MKKNVLALSIAAMIGGLSRPKPEIPDANFCGNHYGAVRVRFRGQPSEDDLRDFMDFLSPSDVWTAAVCDTACCIPPTTCITTPPR